MGFRIRTDTLCSSGCENVDHLFLSCLALDGLRCFIDQRLGLQ